MTRSPSVIVSIVIATLLVASAQRTVQAAKSCKAPRVLVVLDKSSSMLGLVGSESKWNVAKGALSKVLSSYQSAADFGLMIFPSPSQCGPGTVKVPIGPLTSSAILAQLAAAPPKSGNWTPMAQSLDAAPQAKGLQDSAYPRHVLLITDGWQWCSPYDNKTRFLPVNSVTQLAQLGITTHVVGFGAGVDALTLNKMAAAAGTKRSAGCDASASDPAATNHCYYQANDPAALLTALDAIAKKITQEVCDGEDNDCNGKVDDGLTAALCVEQKGVCAGATKTCGGAAGWIQSCDSAAFDQNAQRLGLTYQLKETLCDGQDNDCDGTVDEGCECSSGQTRPCGNNEGVCSQGLQRCVAGTWSACEGEIVAATEVCDGQDNDCNGKTDEALTRQCKSACGVGVETCQAGAFDGCTAPQPGNEICDGLDNDCDGTVDGPNALCENGGTCVAGICETPPQSTGGSGCDCTVGEGQASAIPAFWLTLLAIIALRRRLR